MKPIKQIAATVQDTHCRQTDRQTYRETYIQTVVMLGVFVWSES